MKLITPLSSFAILLLSYSVMSDCPVSMPEPEFQACLVEEAPPTGSEAPLDPGKDGPSPDADAPTAAEHDEEARVDTTAHRPDGHRPG